MRCPHCGRDLSDAAAFCPGCGHPFDTVIITAVDPYASPKSRLVALLLYAALVHWRASPLALTAGLALAQLVALTSYARAYRRAGRIPSRPAQEDRTAPAVKE